VYVYSPLEINRILIKLSLSQLYTQRYDCLGVDERFGMDPRLGLWRRREGRPVAEVQRWVLPERWMVSGRRAW